MKKLEVQFNRTNDDTIPVGTLVNDRGRIYFQYSPDFLATELNLSPFRLPFEPELFEHRDLDFGPLPGLFDDSLPDGWGLLLMDHHFRNIGQTPAAIDPLDRLAFLGTQTMGALTYHPPADREEVDNSVWDLHDLARQTREILAGDAVEVLPQLLRAGGSPGGARPKVLLGYNPDTGEVISSEDDLPEGFEQWIVKFTSGSDTEDAGAVEYAYSLMAKQAGIEMPPTNQFETVEGDSFFGVKRFDRDRGNRRYHVHTFGNAIQSNFRIPSADYADLLKATSLLTRNNQDILRCFRRMVFNVLAHNRDDHVKNFAFILDDTSGNWALAPAYDLLFTSGPNGHHTMTIGGEGHNPGCRNMIKLAKQFGVSEQQATSIIDEVRSAINNWTEHATKAGVREANIQEIGRIMDQQG